MATNTAAPELYRIWITRYDKWRPSSWRDLPPKAVALELAENHCYGPDAARAYLEGHNQAALQRRDRCWAVAVPVVLAFDGDPAPGDVIFPRQVALTSCGT